MVPEMGVKLRDVQYALSWRRPVESTQTVTAPQIGPCDDIVFPAGPVQFADAAAAGASC